MMSICLSAIFTLLVALFGRGNCDSSGVEAYTKVLNNHNPLVPPSQNISVTVGLDLSSIIDIEALDFLYVFQDTKTQTMISRLNLHLHWNDQSLSWTQKQFPRMDFIELPPSRIWTPNIVLWNSVEDKSGAQREGIAVISPTGQVHWTIPATFKSSCTIDVTYYPFDQQTCVLKFGAQDNSVQVSLHNNRNWGNLANYYLSVVWGIVEFPAYENKYPTNEDNIMDTDVTYYITLRRYTYWPSQVYPLLSIAFLTLLPCFVTKFLPKLSLELVCMVGLFFINKDLTDTLPPTHFVKAHVLVYLSDLVIFNLIHLTLTCILSNLHKNQLDCLTKWIPKGIANKISMLLCVRTQKREKEIETENQQTDSVKMDEPEWQGGHALMNRLILIGLFAAVITATLHFLLAHPHLGETLDVNSIVSLHS